MTLPKFIFAIFLLFPAIIQVGGAQDAGSSVTEISSSRYEKLKAKLGENLPKDSQVEFGFGDELIFTVENLEGLVKSASGREIIPFIEGIPLRGMSPLPFDPAAGELRYILQFDEKYKDDWKSILGGWIRIEREYRPGQISVGVDGPDGYPIKVDIGTNGKDDLRFIILEGGLVLVAVGLMAIFALGLILLSTRSNLIRDAGPESPHGLKPYSLARFQMAIFFALVIVSFIYLFVITRGTLPAIPSTVLVLIGISAGTGLAVIVQDKGKPTRKEMLESEVVKLEAKPELTNLEMSELTEAKSQVKQLKGASPPTSKGFIEDVLKDGQGISFHRFQIFCWTLVLAGVFIFKVLVDLSMPDFNATLLGLMGISSGTYLGFMIPEESSADLAADQSANPASGNPAGGA